MQNLEKLSELQYKIAGNSINFSSSVKYLDIHLNQSLTDGNDIMKHVCILQEISWKVIF